MLKVTKFGGSSVSDASQFRKVKAIIESDESRRIAVISAAGKRNSEDHKLTDLLYLCHAHLTYGVSCDEIFNTIASRFIEIRDELGLSFRVEDEIDAIRKSLNRDMSVDELVSRGEYLTSRLMAEFLGFHFLDARDCIFMDYDGSFDMVKISSAVSEALAEYGNLVIPGFYGRIPSGKVRVMSRGGSDITGALAASAVKADVYENWTDVSGILMADPRIVKNPRPISRITYGELRELAFMGASVLHEDAVQPVRESGIALNIRNTNEPDNPGTLIVERIDGDSKEDGRFITGIAGRRNFDIITVVKHNMDCNEGLRKVLKILDQNNTPVEHISMGLDSFAFVISQAAVGNRLDGVVAEIRNAISPDDIKIRDGIALVAAVGRKMGFRPGISGKLFKALGENGVNIRTIAQDADELSIIVGVENSQYETAVRVLYEGFAG